MILDELEDMGVEVLRGKIIDEVSINELVLNDGVIYVLDENSYETLPESIKTILHANEVPIIMIVNATSSTPLIKNVLTSITLCMKGEELENAVNICREFMPKNNNSIVVDRSLRNCTYNILLAEDDYILREVQKIIFENAGFELKVAKDGREALLLLNQHEYDLVIVDLHMPSMSGLEVAVKYREEFPDVNTKFILLTADINKELLVDDSQKIFNSILIEPTTATELLNEVYKALESDGRANNKLVLNVRKGSASNIINQMDKFPCCYLSCTMIDENIANIGVNAMVNILNMYDKEIVHQLIEMESAFENGLHGKLKDIFHTLRGTSSSMGTIMFNVLIEYMLVNISNENNLNSIKVLMNELMKVHNLSIIALNIYINSNYH